MRLWGMDIRWPWDHSKADAHGDRVAQQEVAVERLHSEAMKQKRENNIGPMLGQLFVTPPQRGRKP